MKDVDKKDVMWKKTKNRGWFQIGKDSVNCQWANS